MCILSISIIFCFNPGWNPKRFVRYRLLILYSHVRQCAAAALAGAAAAVAWKSLQKCPRPDSTECASRLCWQGGHRPVRRAGGRQAIASKPDRPSSCKIRHLTPPLSIPPLSLILGTSWLGTVHYCMQHAEQFLPPRIHPYEPSWCLTPFVN